MTREPAVPPDAVSLDPVQCLRLMARHSVGRLVYTRNALPAVQPVRYRLVDGGSVLVDRPDEELLRAVAGSVVAFQADEVDPADGSGWTVTVLGHADAVPPGPASGPPAVAVRIRPEWVSGLRLLPARPERRADRPRRPGPPALAPDGARSADWEHPRHRGGEGRCGTAPSER
ncbi:pyridoxamine 5'-phosphate oxidase family protein [Kitasatospora sp. NPDC059646]|uniref:pyridoxamine 5'-phosphate oxidase family protein n=1 Tax=Kitasatospora sp. NPDC059646 TaxID=3346893 RepID=UPI00369BB7C7